MTPDFSPKMLRGFLNAHICMAGYRASFPNERTRRPVQAFGAACAAERARIIKRAGVTDEQMELAIAGRVIGRAARERLWKALGADPASHGVRLVGSSGQERVP